MMGGGFVDSFTGFIKDHCMMICILIVVAIVVIVGLSMMKKKTSTAVTVNTGATGTTTGTSSSYAAEPWNAAPTPIEFGHGIKTRSYMTPNQAQRMLAKAMKS